MSKVEEAIKGMTPEMRKALATLLMSIDEPEQTVEETSEGIQQDVFEENKVEESKVNSRDPFTMRQEEQPAIGRSAVPRMSSTWKDDGSEHKDVKTNSGKRVERTRSKFKRVKKICSRCGQEEETYPDISYGKHFICNSCIGG